jgi:hypothetical protein
MASFRKKRSMKYKRRNTRRNIRRNTRRKYIKARKSRINRRSRKSLEGGGGRILSYLFPNRKVVPIVTSPTSEENNKRTSLLHQHDEYNEPPIIEKKLNDAQEQRLANTTWQLDNPLREWGEMIVDPKTAEEREKKAAAFADSYNNLNQIDKNNYAAIEAMRKPILKTQPLSELWEGAESAYMNRFNN